MLEDVYVFKVPCSLTIPMLSRKTLSVEQYKEIVSNPQNIKRQEVLDHKLTLKDFIQKF